MAQKSENMYLRNIFLILVGLKSKQKRYKLESRTN